MTWTISTRRRHAAACLLGVAVITTLAGPAGAAEWPSSLNLSTLDGDTGFRLDGASTSDYSGFSVSDAGDINGDGFGDVIIGAYNADHNGAESGSSYVVFGKANGFAPTNNLAALNGTTGFRIDGVAAGDFSGRSVSAAGDVNGDGFGDLIIGTYDAASGSSYVVFGKAGGFASALDLSSLNGSNGFRLESEAPGNHTGQSVAAAGDVNGDGFGDVIVGAYGADHNGSGSGSSYVAFGKASGFTPVLNLSALNGSNGFRLDGAASPDGSGFSVSAAGDVNGDGFGDVIIGAPGGQHNGTNSGSSYVVFGKAGSFAPVINLSTINGTSGFRLDGEAAGHQSGSSVSAAGDVNGDGFADVIVGALNAAGTSGSSYVVFGKAGGFASSLELSGLDGGNGFRLAGDAIGDRSGGSVSTAGDVNGDGFSDVIVGAYKADANGSNSGSSYLVFGKAGGFVSSLSLSNLNGVDGVRLDGPNFNESSGRSVSTAGDVNGDGFGDVIVGANSADSAAIDSGSSYVVFGRAPDASALRIGSRARQTIQGGAFADVLVAADANDVLEGRDGGDVLVGSIGTTASYAHAESGVAASLLPDAINGGVAFGDSYYNIAHLEGSSFADFLTGNGSANVITGGKGKDQIRGGKGKDTFGYRNSIESPPGAANADIVFDFDPGTASSVVDRIDLSAIDADTTKGGNQAFAFLGTKPFSGKAQLRLKVSGNDIILQGNTGGSTLPEFEIVLKGLKSKVTAITAKDFKL